MTEKYYIYENLQKVLKIQVSEDKKSCNGSYKNLKKNWVNYPARLCFDTEKEAWEGYLKLLEGEISSHENRLLRLHKELEGRIRSANSLKGDILEFIRDNGWSE